MTSEPPVVDASASEQTVQLLAAVQGMTLRPTPAPAQPTPEEVHAAAAALQAVTAPDEVAPAAFPGAGNAIKDAYDLVEEYVAWGVSVAQWAVGWVPWVGLLSGQIGIFYDFGEAIARSVVYNFADWVGGSVSFGQGLANIGNDTAQAVSGLVRDEIRWVRSFFPPLPPLPPIGSAADAELRPAVGVARSGAAAQESAEETTPVTREESAVQVPAATEATEDTLQRPSSRTSLRDTLREVTRTATDSVERARDAGVKHGARGVVKKPAKKTATTKPTAAGTAAGAGDGDTSDDGGAGDDD